MAMQMLTPEEFESELIRRGCQKRHNDPKIGQIWQTADGRIFQVPAPEHLGGRYPDAILDDIIRTHGLPNAPTKHG